MRKSLFLLFFLIISCSTPNNSPLDNSLNPYLTGTPQNINTPNILFVETTPIPTNTPQIYIIEAGDTISGIAEKFKISQADLRAANPDVNPNALSIGDSILIPDPSAQLVAASTPTPIPVPITQTVCYADLASGLHCFALIQNNTAIILENVSAKINLLDENKNVIASQIAFTLLDIISVNSSLPVYVYFPNINQKVTAQVQLLSAMQSSSNNYLPAIINNSVTEINGKYANVSGQIYLSQPAIEVWIAAVAYDKNGIVVGVKRWEGGATQAGVMTPFSFSVASVGADIEAVEFFSQARP